MASSTITILQSMEWCKMFVFRRQLAIGGFKEPLITSANLIYQTILGPPFFWRWNRQIVNFTVPGGQQDYSFPANLGWIENASVQDTTASKWYECSPKIDLALDGSRARPQHISGQIDDGAGNITFRFMPVPDKDYPVSITMQQKAALITSLNQTWAPIPDEYSYIYQTGLLALCFLFADDPRFATMNQKFVAHLLGAAQGLTDTERNLFLNQWQSISGAPILNQANLSQGSQAKGSL